MDMVGVIMDIYQKYGVDYIVIDKTGVGQGIYDRIRQLDYPVRGVSFGEKSDEDMFVNLKAEWHWRERKWLLSGGRLIEDYGWNEFEYVKYKNRDGKIAIQPKEELLREGLMSPNCVDAAVLTQVVTDATVKGVKIHKARGGQFYDAMVDVYNN
jgi:hypothetical protein